MNENELIIERLGPIVDELGERLECDLSDDDNLALRTALSKAAGVGFQIGAGQVAWTAYLQGVDVEVNYLGAPAATYGPRRTPSNNELARPGCWFVSRWQPECDGFLPTSYARIRGGVWFRSLSPDLPAQSWPLGAYAACTWIRVQTSPAERSGDDRRAYVE